MKEIKISDQIKLSKKLLDNGAVKVGFADLNLTQNDEIKYPSAISIMVKLDPAVIKMIVNKPTQEYCEEYNSKNNLLDSLVNIACNYLIEVGYFGVTSGVTVKKSELDSYKPILPHKTAAGLSGLGWIGKNALLITEEYGSAVRLATVFTDAVFAYDKPQDSVKCKSCTVCKDACPGKAIMGVNWSPDIEQKKYYNRDMCRKTIESFVSDGIVERAICGICISSCPFTKRYIANSKC